ncbi:uncharacterized protein K489DRAFT_375565 [Dissoconium aciculare CBS 342.82]|uniref:Uncharacterized protein n=1 Tax=Dissoconium aciculare CBS 342.82 TaxID=1314786 RepID=A0A6J3MHN3_9PEZI|nr:uncharacterized protein K489DRAFT_375565 [Dissoconium aciculare CBS 342.82]KAF1827466.1 hypothetical protein K489DRAFT_375565 [Dissoconium aciculare CBS 342.82]
MPSIPSISSVCSLADSHDNNNYPPYTYVPRYVLYGSGAVGGPSKWTDCSAPSAHWLANRLDIHLDTAGHVYMMIDAGEFRICRREPCPWEDGWMEICGCRIPQSTM